MAKVAHLPEVWLLSGNRLKEMRKANNLTQEQLTEKIQTLPENKGKARSEKSIGRMERGEMPISPEYAFLISRVLGCRVEYLLAQDDYETEAERIHAITDEHNSIFGMIETIAQLHGYSISSQEIDYGTKRLSFPADIDENEILQRAHSTGGVPYFWITSSTGAQKRIDADKLHDMFADIEDYIVYKFSNCLSRPRPFRR